MYPRIFMLFVSALVFSIVTIWTNNQTSIMPVAAQAQSDFSCTNVSEIPQIECEALVAIIDANPDPDSDVFSDWLNSDTPCSWDRITCKNGQV